MGRMGRNMDQPAALTDPPPDAGFERPPIVRQNLHDAVVGRVRDMIIEGELAPGSRIHEGNLGRALGVSRTPLREALKFLASEGLIELVPARGAIVRRFTPKDVQDALSVLGSLEALAGRLACAQASDAELAEIRRVHDAMMECYAARDRLPYFKLNQEIHSRILAASGNAVLAYVHGILQARLKRIRYVGNEAPDRWAGAVADHEAIIAALDRRDGEAAAAALAAHMEASWERVRDSVADAPESAPG
ncbi:DNA-binding GntR family transcriptional regulator [Stella humosa]|uniref:DNA-binding GntR family transcriptional regulator n=2 Tax=Stella humosa TaxID=94 RepID=A0A3N1LN17_9PROT|nr:DNA-binding GntR family transcriptional regulator [Stella humosa]BBK29499.1 GntR family transcriptional regulator [Stella humosa]